MIITIYAKENKACYTVSHIASKRRLLLEALGWQYAGRISGRDMSGNFPTMTKILQEAKDAR